jgi:hypothetical protein
VASGISTRLGRKVYKITLKGHQKIKIKEKGFRGGRAEDGVVKE